MSRALPLVQVSEKGSVSLREFPARPCFDTEGGYGANHPDSLMSKEINGHFQARIYPARGGFLMHSA